MALDLGEHFYYLIMLEKCQRIAIWMHGCLLLVSMIADLFFTLHQACSLLLFHARVILKASNVYFINSRSF